MAGNYCEYCNLLQKHVPNKLSVLDSNSDIFVDDVKLSSSDCDRLKKDLGFSNNADLNNDCKSLEALNDCINGDLEQQLKGWDECDWKGFFGRYLKSIYLILNSIICSICGIWKAIHDIEDDLKKLAGGAWTTLDPSNYNFTYRNGFRSNSGYLRVRYKEFSTHYVVQIVTFQTYDSNGNTTDFGIMTNPNLKSNSRFRHSSLPYKEPKSVMYQLSFKGSVANWNNLSYSGATQQTNIWNCRITGSSQPLDWSVYSNLYHKYSDFSTSTWNGWKITACSSSIGDGYNNQYSDSPWYKGGTLVGNYLNQTNEFILNK